MARADGNLDWLTERPAPKGFYGLPEFERSSDAKILGRKTYDRSLEMGARFSESAVHYVFSRRPPPASMPAGVHFVTESIRAFAERLRTQAGKNVWMMGGGEITLGPSWTSPRLTSSSSPSCQPSSGKVFLCLHRGIVRWRSARSVYNNSGRRRSAALPGAEVKGLSQPYGGAAACPFHGCSKNGNRQLRRTGSHLISEEPRLLECPDPTLSRDESVYHLRLASILR